MKKDKEMTDEELNFWFEEFCTKGFSKTFTAEEAKKLGLTKGLDKMTTEEIDRYYSDVDNEEEEPTEEEWREIAKKLKEEIKRGEW